MTMALAKAFLYCHTKGLHIVTLYVIQRASKSLL